MQAGWLIVIPVFSRLGGMESVMTGQAIMSIVSSCFHVSVVLLLARGLVKLAQLPKAPDVPAAGKYR